MLLISSGVLLAACNHSSVAGVPYSVGVSGEGNQVAITTASDDLSDGYLVTVESQRGVGQSSFAWWGSEPPHPLKFLVRLEGLESFLLGWQGQTVTVSVNSTDHHVLQSLRTADDLEQQITPESPYWITVALPTTERSGYMLTAPPAFHDDAPRLWAIQWVDFYR